jgi:hypothetical protein
MRGWTNYSADLSEHGERDVSIDLLGGRAMELSRRIFHEDLSSLDYENSLKIIRGLVDSTGSASAGLVVYTLAYDAARGQFDWLDLEPWKSAEDTLISLNFAGRISLRHVEPVVEDQCTRYAPSCGGLVMNRVLLAGR